MKVVIFAGGFGTRISEETHLKPKPMIEIGDRPILWHIMKGYAHYGFTDFIILCGYKSFHVKEYFLNYAHRAVDFKVRLGDGNVEFMSHSVENWTVSVVDTGLNTMTGGRLKRIRHLLGEEDFLLTYGDGVADINISELVQFHKDQKTLATLTAVKPVSRYGVLSVRENKVAEFREKRQEDVGLINGGFFVINPKVIDNIAGDETIWEENPLENLAHKSQLSAYRHKGFWHPMDTKRDHEKLQNLWDSGEAPWKIWN